MKVALFDEVRVTKGLRFTPNRHLFFDGVGHFKGEPGGVISGRLNGTVKVTPLKRRGFSGPYWFSLREVGNGGQHRLVYLHSTATVVVDGEDAALGTWYGRTGGRGF